MKVVFASLYALIESLLSVSQIFKSLAKAKKTSRASAVGGSSLASSRQLA